MARIRRCLLTASHASTIPRSHCSSRCSPEKRAMVASLSKCCTMTSSRPKFRTPQSCKVAIPPVDRLATQWHEIILTDQQNPCLSRLKYATGPACRDRPRQGQDYRTSCIPDSWRVVHTCVLCSMMAVSVLSFWSRIEHFNRSKYHHDSEGYRA